MSLHKAKRISTGEWVMGSHVQVNEKHYILDSCGYDRVKKRPFYGHEIKPSTLCQQVPTKDWFVGDEVVSRFGGSGIIEFDKSTFTYLVKGDKGEYFELRRHNWKPTGKNKHDDE
jgi:hypothetical protein